MARNYIAELRLLGKSLTSIASELNRSPSTISRWAAGKTSPPSGLYEPIRNVSRRYMYKTMREAGFTPSKAGGRRRFIPARITKDISGIERIIDTLYHDWNASYRAYKRNPKGWIKAHPNRKIPRETSKDEIRRRIEKGGKTKSVEELENY